MNKLTKQIRRTWKSAQLYIGFHVDPKGRKCKTPKVWPAYRGWLIYPPIG